MVQEKIAAFALVDDFKGENLTKMGGCLYQNNIIPIVISLKKGRNVVDRDKTIMTETDLTFARARTQIDALILSDDFSIEQLMDHGPFRKLVEKMVAEGQPVTAIGKIPDMLVKAGIITREQAAEKLITAKSIEQADLVCNRLVDLLRKAA